MIKLTTGEELTPGQWVKIDPRDGKLRKALPGDERPFRIPPNATFDEGIVSWPA